jgi:CubicO group peptidase (beta-lactamase class C family)
LPLDNDDLRDLAASIAGEIGVPGAQIAVLHNGTVLEGCAGLASVETGTPVTPDTLFQVGSTTKLHTAALVMQLVDEGRIDLDTPVAEQLPGFRLSEASSTRSLTPRHLLSMSSGIDNGPYTDYGRGDDALARYVDGLAEIPSSFAPGAGFGYSNASTNVSGRLIEHVTEMPWENALRQRLLEPAGLHQSATAAEDVIWRRFAVGHTIDGVSQAAIIPAWSLPRSMGPAGGTLCSSAGDLVRLSSVFVNEGRSLDGEQVLSPAAVKAMQLREVAVPPTLLAEWWGLGPYGKVWDGVDIMGHSGTNLAGSSYLLWARERGVAIATTVNAPGFGYPFAARVFEELFPRLAAINVPARPKPPVDVTVDVERLLGVYAMCGTRFTIQVHDGELHITPASDQDGEDRSSSPLIPMSPTTFLPTDPTIDGRRGWAIAFVGPEDEPATHLINGFFAMRRVAG